MIRWGVTGGLLPVMLLACAAGSDESSGDASALGVSVQAVKRETLRDVARASGAVVPSRAGDWTVYAPEPGDIVELPKAEGDAVAVGDLLLRLDIAARTQERAALELEVMAAEQAFERASAEVARQAPLVERGLLAPATYAASRSAQSAAQSALAQVRSSLESLKAAPDPTIVRARFAGTVAKVWKVPGERVEATTDPILRVVDPTRVQIAIQLPPAQLARVVPGQAAVVRVFGATAEEPATVVFKPEALDPSAAAGEVRLALQNPVALPLDTPASVELLLDVRTDVLTVPSTAIQSGELGAYVMVPGDDGLARRRDVRVGLVAGERTQVASGLTEGEPVIIGGLTDESSGLPVVVVP